MGKRRHRSSTVVVLTGLAWGLASQGESWGNLPACLRSHPLGIIWRLGIVSDKKSADHRPGTVPSIRTTCLFMASSPTAVSGFSNYWKLFKKHSMTVLVPAFVAYAIYADYTNTQNFKRKKAELDEIIGGEKNQWKRWRGSLLWTRWVSTQETSRTRRGLRSIFKFRWLLSVVSSPSGGKCGTSTMKHTEWPDSATRAHCSVNPKDPTTLPPGALQNPTHTDSLLFHESVVLARKNKFGIYQEFSLSCTTMHSRPVGPAVD